MNPQIDPYSGNVPRQDPKLFAEYISEVTRLAADGGAVQVESENGWTVLTKPSWSWSEVDYRISPTSKPKKTVCWRGPDDVPKVPVIWLRYVNMLDFLLVVGVHPNILRYGQSGHIAYDELTQYQYSTDRITWKPCTVEVEG